MIWQTTRFKIDLTHPRVMGIVNLTPDSFSDGGHLSGPAAAIAHCERLLSEGADILDIGGESSRPGAEPVPAGEEWSRVEPVLRAALGLGCPVSVDTMKTEVMQRAIDLGVDIINDIQALRAPGAAAAVAASQAGICLMHMRGEPRSMQAEPPVYADVVVEVAAFLGERAAALRTLGMAADRITLDPGIGFGKTVAQNFALLAGQQALLALGYPVLAGWSRKSSLGSVTGRSIGERLAASVAAALASVLHGARIVRVHDVAATVDAIKVWQAAGLPAQDERAASRPTADNREKA
jgi:dihydropteroate synthase